MNEKIKTNSRTGLIHTDFHQSTCAATYIIVGMFGYVALSQSDLGGNVLTAYQPSTLIKAKKLISMAP